MSAARLVGAASNQNAYAERWVQSVKMECLDRYIVFGEDHLRLILEQYVEHYNEE